MRRLLPLLIAALVLGTTAPAYAFGSSPDATYGSNGTVTLPTGSSYPLLIQQGTWTYVASTNWGTSPIRAQVTRLNSSGTPDPAFGDNGVRVLGARFGQAAAMTVSVTGQIHLAVANPELKGWALALVHLTPDGTVDRSYGSFGRALVSRNHGDVATAITADDSGDLLVAGGRTDTPTSQHPLWNGFVLRALPSGAIDTSFAGDGRVDFPGRNTYASHAWAAGDTTVVSGASGRRGWVVRLLGDGSLDPTFGAGGTTAITARGANVQFAVAKQTSAGIVLEAFAVDRTTHQGRLLVEHLGADGQVDPAYGVVGRSRLAVCAPCYGAAWDIGDDGTVALAGEHVGRRGQLRPFLAAVLPDGQPDAGFGSQGWRFVGVAQPQSWVNDLAISGAALLLATDSFGRRGEIGRVTKFVAGP